MHTPNLKAYPKTFYHEREKFRRTSRAIYPALILSPDTFFSEKNVKIPRYKKLVKCFVKVKMTLIINLKLILYFVLSLMNRLNHTTQKSLDS